MATKNECAEALDRLAEKLGRMDDEHRSRHQLERTVSCRVPDLDITFNGLLKDARLLDVKSYEDAAAAPPPRAQIRLTIPSDDLLKLVDGKLNFLAAWTSGRIKVNASFGDLLKLRKVF